MGNHPFLQAWVQDPGTSTSGQFTLWHEHQVTARKTQRDIVSCLLFHVRETQPAPRAGAASDAAPKAAVPHGHATVEIMFVATEPKHREKKFFVQLLRLFMQEVRLIAFSSMTLQRQRLVCSHLLVTLSETVFYIRCVPAYTAWSASTSQKSPTLAELMYCAV